MSFNPVKTVFKSLGVALVSAGISFFLGVFLAIVALVIYSVFAHQTPDYSIAYRLVAAPLAILVFVVAFTTMFVRDVRNVGH